MPLRVKDVQHVLPPDADIDPTAAVDVETLDKFVFACGFLAKEALRKSAPPPGFTDFERDQLASVIEGQSHSHKSIRRLLQGEQSASAVDALTIARLQLETLYSFCFMLQDAENVRLFLKNGWKRRYIRFLLEREERRRLPRFQGYLSNDALPGLDKLQHLSSVTDLERRTIEHDELGTSTGPRFTRVKIEDFPTPMGVIKQINSGSQKKMLERLYPEYQFLCSFAHPAADSLLFRAVSNPRSPLQSAVSSEKLKDFYQRQVLEPAVTYSTLAAVQVATEVAAICPADVDLVVRVMKAWTFLVRSSLLAVPIWEIRAKNVLPLI
jgi:hypothetical protein